MLFVFFVPASRQASGSRGMIVIWYRNVEILWRNLKRQFYTLVFCLVWIQADSEMNEFKTRQNSILIRFEFRFETGLSVLVESNFS